MPKASANGIEIEFETQGDAGNPPLMLVMGLSGQLVSWDPDFVDILVDAGFFVIRHDNRDAGLSTHLETQPVSTRRLAREFVRSRTGRLRPDEVPYTLGDMAADAFGVLDHLDVASAHVAGISMGGMIAQTMAITAPERVRSLTSIASTTGDRRVGGPSLRAMQMFLQRAPRTPAEAVEASLRNSRLLSGPHYEEDRLRRRAERTAYRCLDPVGTQRQTRAVLAASTRSPLLRYFDRPTTVIHGGADPLIDISGGLRTATVVPGARFYAIEDMGHDIATAHFGTIAGAIAENAARGDVLTAALS